MKNNLILMCLLFLTYNTNAQDFYAIDTIQKIEINFSQPNWDYILDTSKQGVDGYTIAQWVKINGVQFDSVGVKYKGNSSYNINNQKNPFHIELNYIKNQDYQGYKDIKLSNGFKDPSFTREVLAYSILRKYMHSPKSNFAKVYVNGQQIGLYANTEAINKTFVNTHFFSNTYPFFFMDSFDCGLNYKGPDSTLYFNYTIKSTYGWNALVNLCNTLQNNISQIETVLDVDRALWMLAFDNILVNLDSYIGQPKHNYYAYQDHNGRFNPIVWDVNEAFGNFVNAGTGPSLSILQEQTMSPMIHINDSAWPLIKKLLNIPIYKKMYIAHAKTILNENFADSSYYNYALFLQSIVDTAFQSDPNKFYSYSQFLSNVTTNVTNGPFTSPGITYLMEARKNYLTNTTEFQQIAPTLLNVQSSNNSPSLNDTIYITAQVLNATMVFCGMRNSIMEKFTRFQMFDDGLNGDGTAGDGTFGIKIIVSYPEIHYYIYTENNNAGIFSPARAEHEWYTINSNYTIVTSGSIVINELMASNVSTQANGLGNYNDWVELYNNTSDTISMNNLYLSDDYTNSLKWQFPNGTSILPNNYLIVWADIDSYPSELHSGYKLSATGEQLILSYANGTIIDSVSFPSQNTDISYGRYPNGIGQFGQMYPTFSASNSPISVNKLNINSEINVFPNPVHDILYYTVNDLESKEIKIQICSLNGEIKFETIQKLTNNNYTGSINIENYNKGFYIIKFIGNFEVINKKLIKI